MQDIDTFVDQQRQAGLSAATVKRRVAALKVFFDFLAEETGDLSWANPVRFKRHAGKQPRQLPRDLKDDEVGASLGRHQQPARPGLVRPAVARRAARGRAGGPATRRPAGGADGYQPARLRVLGKGQKERLVLLTADAYAVLTAWLAERPASDTPTIFLNDRGQPLTVNGIEWLLHQYGQQAGVTLTPHQLRHTFARQVTEAGMPITSLSKLLGHAQITTTQIYTAGADPQLAQAYQQAMAHVAPAAAPPDPARRQPASAPLDTTIAPLAPPALPEWAAWGTHLPPALRQASLDFVRSRLAHWKPQRQRHRALQVLGELRRFWDWLAARRPGFSLAEVQLRDLQTYRSERIASGCSRPNPRRDVILCRGLAARPGRPRPGR